MGYADGYYYGQGRIICDTSTFSVGDTIRVRSMTDSNKVWNKQVATVGTALVFTVPCYDYYKICTVQDIGGTPTEIGGVYKTVDYGQTLFINVLDKTTLGGIQGILNAHQEASQLAIGDEVNITVDGVLTPFLIGAINLYDTHEVIFVGKYIAGTSTWGGYSGYGTTVIKQFLETFYNNIKTEEKALIKATDRSSRRPYSSTQDTYTEYVFANNHTEIDGNPVGWPVYTQSQFPIFTTQNNRIKSYEGNTRSWWLSDGYNASNSSAVYYVETNGSIQSDNNPSSTSRGILPCFRLTADS